MRLDTPLAMFAALAMMLCTALPAFAQSAADDERAKALFGELRCVVCQNQSILDSDADVARDLRSIVREQLDAGRTDDEIKTFLVDRYGEFILLKPVFSAHTLLLWIAPLLFIGVGGFLVLRVLARRSSTEQPAAALSAEEEQRIAVLLQRGDGDHAS
ncbi:MAG: cytochrome c-type biogenesis protein CcmH [Ahrensia sp.]|nr:cytochrome c-type biogenesis protein CcmH [Ahrensia sp.]